MVESIGEVSIGSEIRSESQQAALELGGLKKIEDAASNEQLVENGGNVEQPGEGGSTDVPAQADALPRRGNSFDEGALQKLLSQDEDLQNDTMIIIEDEEPPRPSSSSSPCGVMSAAERRANEASDALEGLALFGNEEAEEQKDDDEEEEDGNDLPTSIRQWYSKPKSIVTLSLLILSAACLLAGIFLQVLESSPEKLYVFRWLYFFASFVPSYCVCRWSVRKITNYTERRFYRGHIGHLESVRKCSTVLSFLLTEGLLFAMIFRWAFCSGRYTAVCADPAYETHNQYVARIILSGIVASIASWLAAVFAKLLSANLFCTTYARKLEESVQAEFYLHKLSKPKRRAMLAKGNKQRAAAKRGQARGAGGLSQSRWPVGSNYARSTTETCTASVYSSVAGDLHGASTLSSKAFSNMGEGTEHGNRLKSMLSASSDNTLSSLSTQDAVATPGLPGEEELFIKEHRMSPEITDGMLDLALDVDHAPADERELEHLRTAMVMQTYSKLKRWYDRTSTLQEKQRVADAKAFASALFANVIGHHAVVRDYVLRSDFELFFEDTPEGHLQAEQAFAIFDTSGSGEVRKKDIRRGVIQVFKQRGNIAEMISDTDSIVKNLEWGIAGALHYLFVVIYLAIWGADAVAAFTSFAASLLGLSFMFGNSLKNVFESLVFLFSVHAYDVGDTVMVDDQLFSVKRIHLLHTHAVDMMDCPVYLMHTQLQSSRIVNWTRSKVYTEFAVYEVDVGFGEEVKAALVKRIKAGFAKRPNDFLPSVSANLRGARKTGLKCEVQIVFTYNCSADDWATRTPARDLAFQIISDVLSEYRGRGVEFTEQRVELASDPAVAAVSGISPFNPASRQRPAGVSHLRLSREHHSKR